MEFKTKRFRSFDDSIFLTFMLFSDDMIFFDITMTLHSRSVPAT